MANFNDVYKQILEIQEFVRILTLHWHLNALRPVALHAVSSVNPSHQKPGFVNRGGSMLGQGARAPQIPCCPQIQKLY